MKLLFVVQGMRAVATRYRVHSYVPLLREWGWEVDVVLIRRAGECHVVFVQKKRMPCWQLRWIKGRGAKIVYDVDDAVMFRSSRRGASSSSTRQRRFDRAIAHADLVLAGNPYLAGIIEEKHPNVKVQPLPFDLSKYPLRENHAAEGDLVIGWIGGRKSLSFLQSLSPVFERLGERHPETRLKIVCNAFFEMKNMPVIEKAWAEEEEGADVASFHIGVAPLPDDVWARGKCGTKLLQCFCAGVPVVASPVGVHKEMITSSRGGIIAPHQKKME